MCKNTFLPKEKSTVTVTAVFPLFRQATYVGVGLKLLQLVPSLLCLTRDTDFIRGEQTILVSEQCHHRPSVFDFSVRSPPSEASLCA